MSINHSYYKLVVIFCSLQFLFSTAYAQSFKGGITIGGTASQITNDRASGYNKLGFTGGLYVHRITESPLYMKWGLGFANKGSRDAVQDFKINLGYIEIPTTLEFVKFHPLHIHAGVAPSIKVAESTTLGIMKIDSNDFSRFDIPFIIGLAYQMFDRASINFRFSYSTISTGITDRFWNDCLYFYIAYSI